MWVEWLFEVLCKEIEDDHSKDTSLTQCAGSQYIHRCPWSDTLKFPWSDTLRYACMSICIYLGIHLCMQRSCICRWLIDIVMCMQIHLYTGRVYDCSSRGGRMSTRPFLALFSTPLHFFFPLSLLFLFFLFVRLDWKFPVSLRAKIPLDNLSFFCIHWLKSCCTTSRFELVRCLC